MAPETKQHVRLETATAWVDGELSPSAAEEIRAHVEHCAECSRRLESHDAIKHAVARLEACDQPPEAVRARIRNLALAHRARAGRRRKLALAAAAAVLLLAGGVTAGWIARDGSEGLADALVADHLRSVPEAKPVEVASDEPEHIRRFFSKRVGFEPVAPSMPGSKLLGGRYCVIEGHAMELLFYEHQEQTLSLFVSDSVQEPEGCSESAGHRVCRRRRGELTLILVGPLPERQMSRLLERARL